MEQIAKHLSLLGLPVKDKVTGFKGIVTSVSFDLYGCIQATVDAGFNEKHERVAHWYDINRLDVTSNKRVMDPPHYLEDEKPAAQARIGAADKTVGR